MTDRLSPEAKEEIRKRAELATPGPWTAVPTEPDAPMITDAAGQYICEFSDLNGEGKRSWTNAEFVSHARTDIPALLRENAELERERELADRFLETERHNHKVSIAEWEKVEAERDSLAAQVERLRGALWKEKDKAYCDYIEQMKKPECLGEDYKLVNGSFGRAEIDAHCRANALLSRHRAFAEVLAALADGAGEEKGNG